MVYYLLMHFLGTKELPKRSQSLVQKFVILIFLIDIAFSISSTFYVLFVIDAMGYEKLGILIGVGFFVQALLDYPSGTLGDWIGQKWILFFADLGFGLSYALLFFAQTYNDFLLVYIVSAIAASQQSGAFGTWFENNYKVSVEDKDPERETFKFFTGRQTSLGNLTVGFSFVIGGLIATLYFREVVFAIQAIFLTILAFILLFSVKNFPEIPKPEISVRNYFYLFFEGIWVVLTNKVLLIFIIGFILTQTMWMIWASLILFPLYIGYTGSDIGASLFRAGIFSIGIIIPIIGANIAKKSSIKRLPFFRAIHSTIFFVGFMIITYFYPIDKNEFQIIPLFLSSIILTIPWILLQVAVIIESRIFLDLIPDRNRNSVYSLIPTLVLLFNTPTVMIGGILLEDFGINATLFVLVVIGLISSLIFTLPIYLLQKDEKWTH